MDYDKGCHENCEELFKKKERNMDTQSAEINELMAALAKAQAVMGVAKKDKTNPFFKSKYADLASIWDACRSGLSDNGLAVVQGMLPIDGVLMLVTTLGHSSGQWMKSYLPIITQKTDPQSLGSGITYMKKYSLAAIAGIAPDDDDDGEKAMGDRAKEGHKVKVNAAYKKEKVETITKQEASMINEMLVNNEDRRSNLMKFLKDNYSIDSLEKIPSFILKRVINTINKTNTKEAVA